MVDRNPQKIADMFNSLAPYYDRNNNIISLFAHRIIKYLAIFLLPKISKDAKILDICCGTGDLTSILAKKFPKATLIGADFSLSMLNIARKKHKNINFIKADYLNLPFQNESFDLVTESFGLRNTFDYDKAIIETARILKPNGIFLHLDFALKEGLANTIFKNLVLFTMKIFKNESYQYLLESIEEFPQPKKLSNNFLKYGLVLIKEKLLLGNVIAIQIYKKKENLS